MNDPHLTYITKALLKGRLRLHTTNKNLSRQKIYKLLRENNIKTLRVIEGPGDELWLLRKEPKNYSPNEEQKDGPA